MPDYGISDKPKHPDDLDEYAHKLHDAIESEQLRIQLRAQSQSAAERSTIEAAIFLEKLYDAQMREREERIAANRETKIAQEARDSADRRCFFANIIVGVISGIAAIIAAVVGIISLVA